MAFRTWGRLLLTALGVSVLAGAGQLGIAYGFGVVRLDAAFTEGSVNRWPAQLAWVGWFAAVAAVTGAVVTGRLARRDAAPAGTPEQLAVAGAAALGATVVAPLCMQPARAAELGGTVDPVWAVGICAILGAVVGAGIAIAALLRPPFGWNIALTVAVVWLLALVSVAPSVASADTLPTVRLGVLEPSWLEPAVAQRLAMLILPAVALLTGAAVGALARRRGHLPLVAGAAGAAGPVLLTFVYLTAGPGDPTDRYQLAPYYGALIAVAAGALGSTATTLLRRPVAEMPSEGTAIVPTDILQPLPASPAVPPARTAAPATGGSTRTDGVDPAAADVPGRPGALTPAHWDWPAPAGVRPASVPAQANRPAGDSTTADPTDEPTTGRRTSDEAATGERPDHEPTAAGRPEHEPATLERTGAEPATLERTGDEPATDERPGDKGTVREPTGDEPVPGRRSGDEAAAGERPGDEAAGGREGLTRHLPVPGLLPTGRRTSAIDVLAAGPPPGAANPPPGAGGPPPGAANPPPGAGASGPGPGSIGPLSPAAPEMAADDPLAAPADPANPTTDGATLATTGAATAPPGGPTPAGAPAPVAETIPTPAGGPASVESAPAGERATARPKRGRGARTGRATGAPADGSPTGGDAPVPPVPTGDGDRATPGVGGTTPPRDEPAADGASGDHRRTTSRFLPVDGDRPAERPRPADGATSPRPRIPIFEDGTDQPRPVLPAWPLAPEPSWPITPRAADSANGTTDPANATDPTGSTTDPTGSTTDPTSTTDPSSRTTEPTGTSDPGGGAADPGGAGGTPANKGRREPAPRPRHRALPDLGRGTGWNPFASARPGTPQHTDPAAPTGAQQPGPAAPATPQRTAPAASAGPQQTGALPIPAEPPASRPTAAVPEVPRLAGRPAAAPEKPETAQRATAGAEEPDRAGDGRHGGGSASMTIPAAGRAPEPGGTVSRLRRGLFRRNRARDAEVVEAEREPEPLAEQDEEFVDWVAGLASDSDAKEADTPRTGRHHRD